MFFICLIKKLKTKLPCSAELGRLLSELTHFFKGVEVGVESKHWHNKSVDSYGKRHLDELETKNTACIGCLFVLLIASISQLFLDKPEQQK